MYRQALAATSPGSPWRPAVLANLGNGLLDRAVTTSDDTGLDEAVQVLTEAVAATDPTAPLLAGRTCNLAHALRIRYERHRRPEDLSAADAYRRACDLAARTSAEVELVAGRAWGMWAARRSSFEEAARVFEHVFDAVERLVRSAPARTSRRRDLARRDRRGSARGRRTP
jgi:hypothetical protein